MIQKYDVADFSQMFFVNIWQNKHMVYLTKQSNK